MNPSALEVTSGAHICMDTMLFLCRVDDQIAVYVQPHIESTSLSMTAQLQMRFHHAVNSIVASSGRIMSVSLLVEEILLDLAHVFVKIERYKHSDT